MGSDRTVLWPLRPRIELVGRGVVVVGATSGIGRATAIGFASHGCRLVLAARDAAELATVAEICRRAGAPVAQVCPVDIGEPADVRRLAEFVRRELKTVDVWANLAAVLVAGDLVDCPVEDIERLVATNVLGTMLCSRAALTTFDAQSQGTLINVSSLLGLVPNPLVPAYCTSKFAIRGLTVTLQRSRRPRGIRICLVMPGPVDTPVFTNAANHTGRQLRAIPPACSPWRVAGAIVRCAQRPRRTVTVGFTGWGLLIGHRFLPRFVEWGVARWSAATVTRGEAASATSGDLFRPSPGGRVTGGYRRWSWRRSAGDLLGRRSATGHPVTTDEPNPVSASEPRRAQPAATAL